jgi:disulfide bond formation protein DsbB
MKIRSGMLVLLLALVLAVVVSACGGSQPSASTPAAPAAKAVALKGDAVKGKEKFLGTCAACHGPDAKGMPNLGKNLTTSTFAKGLSDAALVEFIKTGRPATDPANTTKVAMPPSGGNPALTDQDLADIVAFVRTLENQ